MKIKSIKTSFVLILWNAYQNLSAIIFIQTLKCIRNNPGVSCAFKKVIPAGNFFLKYFKINFFELEYDLLYFFR